MKKVGAGIVTFLLCLSAAAFAARAAAAPSGHFYPPIHILKPIAGARPDTATPSPPYRPVDILGAYGFDNTYTGQGQSIAIVDAYGDSNIESDLAVFCNEYGLPAPSSSNFQIFYPTGQTPSSTDDNWAMETALDVEWIRAIAPGATIYLVVAQSNNNTDLLSAVQTAENLGARVISMSWGGSENQAELSWDDTYFAQSNTVYVASSGDSGKGVEYPAASPNVLSVGGTTLTLNGDGSVNSETAWSGSGGGPSAYEPIPDYQSQFGLSGLTSGWRAIPDVAMDADPNTGVNVYCTQGIYNGWYTIGGTSLAAPIWAAIIGILDQVRGAPFQNVQQAQDTLYKLAGTQAAYNPQGFFRDITSGNNGFSAEPGYDLVTGIGAPVVNKIIQATIAMLPTISSLSPINGPVGTQVTISGANFGATQGSSSVSFNGISAASSSWSSTQIVCSVPSGAASGTVTVTTSDGTSNGVGFTVGQAPAISSLSPTSGPAGAQVTISGANFGATQGSSSVSFNGVSAAISSWSSTQIVCAVPSGATSGAVTVTTSGGTSNGVAFTVIQAPAITSLSPCSGPAGAQVTISGANFGASQGSSSASFNGLSAAPSSWSSTQIVCAVPSGATSGAVTVTTSGGTSNGVAFTVIPAPAISSLSPASGPTGAQVTISGTNFGASQGSSVSFNGVSAATSSWSSTQIVCAVPSGATSGAVTVTTSGGTSNGVAFTVIPAPAVSSLSPASGPTGAQVTISGANFGTAQGSSSVSFNGLSAATSSWSSTQIVCAVPSGARSGAVTVTTSGGTSNGVAFTVIQAPAITSLSPTSGPAGAQVTISGTNFGASQGSSVSFNGVSAATSSWSSTQIVCAVPTGATSGAVTVTTSGGTSNGVAFTVIQAPAVSSLSPASGPAGAQVTISGANFGASQDSSVSFNGVSAAISSWSSTQIVCAVPTGATSGAVTVTTSGGTSNGVIFTIEGMGGLMQNATPTGNNWYFQDWFGAFYTASSPWICHLTLGWLYPVGTSTNSIWFYDPQWDGHGGWWWTSASNFPWVYSLTEQSWLYFDASASAPVAFERWFASPGGHWAPH